MKRVAINQSNYIPWKGYFDLINDVEVFAFYDDVQFTKNDWRNRNRIKTPRGLHWLTIPAGDDLHRLVCDVAIKDAFWQRKHWKSLCQFYGKAPHFKNYRGFFEHVYLESRWGNLSVLNQYLIKAIARDFLGIKSRFIASSDVRSSGKRQDRVLSMLKSLAADVYVSGPAAKSYIDVARFEEEGVKITWKDYSGYPEYPQLHPPFEHAVTILDLLFNAGPDAPYFIWGWREDAHRSAPRESRGPC